MRPLRIATLVKQVPKFEQMKLGDDGRLQREGLELMLNPYCQRAVSKGVELAKQSGGRCTVITLGPPAAEDVLRWGIAWGADDGVLISDPAFAGSDSLATARALAAAVDKLGPFDLILVGKNSVDADTGQVGPELAELLGYPFASAVRTLELDDGVARIGCEHDDAWADAEITLPAVLATAERLCDPAKVDPEGRAAVDPAKITVLRAADLGAGPWGQAGSPTWVGETKVLDVHRARKMLQGPLAAQVGEAIAILAGRNALAHASQAAAGTVAPAVAEPTESIVVLLEPGRAGSAQELLGAAAQLAGPVAAGVTAIQPLADEPIAPEQLAAWGADHVVQLAGPAVAEDVARWVAGWCRERAPWAILGPSTSWGREVASRVAARLDAGLTGDAIELGVDDGKLVCWKPAFGGRLVAAIRASSPTQMATVRPGVLPVLAPRQAVMPAVESHAIEASSRFRVLSHQQNDQLDSLARASRVVGIGQGIAPDDYGRLDPLLKVLGAELAATRKVTDKGWLPHSRQVGITGRSIAPNLYIALAVGGKFNHSCGIQAAGTVLAVNSDPKAPIFEHADIGIVADWAECLPLLIEGFERTLSAPAGEAAEG